MVPGGPGGSGKPERSPDDDAGPDRAPEPDAQLDAAIERFRTHLAHERGLSPRTVEAYASALEVNRGAFDRLGVAVGDVARLER